MTTIRIITICSIILIPSLYMTFLGLSNKKFNLDNFFFTDIKLHDQHYEMFTTDAFRFVKNNTSEKDIFLTFRPSDFGVYAERPFYSYIDGKLIKMYLSKTKGEIHEELSKLNIKYIHLPYYYEPGIYNSKLFDYISDLDYVEPVYQSPKYGLRILKIINTNQYTQKNVRPLKKWTYFNNYRDTELFKSNLNSSVLRLPNSQNLKSFRNEHLTYSSVISGTGAKENLIKNGVFYKRENEVYKIQFKAIGKGFIYVYIHEFDYNNKRLPIKFLLNSTVEGKRFVSTLYKPSIGTNFFKIEIRNHKNDTVAVDNISMETYIKTNAIKQRSKYYFDFACKQNESIDLLYLSCSNTREKSYIKIYPIHIDIKDSTFGRSNILVRTKVSGTVYFTLKECNNILNKDNHFLKKVKRRVLGKLAPQYAVQKNYISDDTKTHDTVLSISNLKTKLCLEYEFSRVDDFFRFNSNSRETKKEFALQSVEIYKLIDNELKLLDILPKKSE